MAVNDRNLSKNSRAARKTLRFGLIPAVSQTDVPFGVHTPGYDFEITEIERFNAGLTGALSAEVAVVGRNQVVTKAGLAIDATAEKFKTLQVAWIMVNGVLVKKAISTAIALTAAHSVATSKFGIILVQINASGTVSTKVPAATPTTAMTYTTAALALAALPTADADNVALGYIAIAADSGAAWVGITDDLTDASDLTTATFVNVAEPTSCFETANPSIATGNGKPALNATIATLRGGSTDSIVAFYTSDGTGAALNGHLNVTFRPRNMNGDGGLAS